MIHSGARRHERARRRARAEVPWYRETSAGTVRAAELERAAFRFYPLSSPIGAGEDLPRAPHDAAALLAALRWAAGPLAGSTVFECRAAWRAPGWLSRARQIRYAAILDAPPGDDPDGRAAALRAAGLDRMAAASRAIVVGDPGQLASLEPATRARRLERLGLHDPALGAPGALVHASYLGYIGAIAPGCGHLHVAVRTHAVSDTPMGVAVTRLGDGRPRLVDVVPDGAERWRVARCPRHGVPVLVAA